MNHRYELIRRTARATNYNHRYVSRVIREFLSQTAALMAESDVVVVDGFGRFTVERSTRELPPVTGKVESQRYVRVHFSKSRALKELLHRDPQESDMEKYGVDTSTGTDDEALEKQAAQGCPDCGGELTKHGSVVACPKCGTAPFEKKRE